MKAKYTVALAMVGSFALGAAAMQGLHDQAKPSGYFIAEVNMSNRDAYTKEFVPLVMKVIKEWGGKYLVGGGRTISLQGTPPGNRVVVIQFESLDKVQAWWDSPARKDSQAIGDKYATFRTYAVEGTSP
jgi:uncharacterized protein (DUF1330 family)